MATPAIIVRFSTIILTTISNILIIAYTIHYMTYKKSKKIKTNLLRMSLLYFIAATIIPLYNLIYRFAITEHQCRISDTIEEIIVALGRALLLILFTFRIQYAFQGSIYEVKPIYLWLFRTVIIIEYIALNALWIPSMSVTAKPSIGLKFGIYCSNAGDLHYTLPHFICDTLFQFILIYLFVSRLISVTKQNKVATKLNDKFIRLALRQTVLALCAMTSTWVFGFSAITDFSKVLGWFYPLDWCINVWCVFLMFSFVKLGFCVRICCVCNENGIGQLEQRPLLK